MPEELVMWIADVLASAFSATCFTFIVGVLTAAFQAWPTFIGHHHVSYLFTIALFYFLGTLGRFTAVDKARHGKR